MRQLSNKHIFQISVWLICAFLFMIISNIFLGSITTHHGKVLTKFIHYNQKGDPFYRVSIIVDSKLVDIQTQPNQYEIIEAGDSITYYVRKALFTNNIVEQYNAKVK